MYLCAGVFMGTIKRVAVRRERQNKVTVSRDKGTLKDSVH